MRVPVRGALHGKLGREIAVAKVVNLGRARKRAKKEAEQTQADANAVRFGRSKAERASAAAEVARIAAIVDGARRSDEQDDP